MNLYKRCGLCRPLPVSLLVSLPAARARASRLDPHREPERGTAHREHALQQRAGRAAVTAAQHGQLSALIRSYLAHIQKEHRTANKAERVLKQFLEFVGDRRAADLGVFQVEKWKLARVKEVGPSTVNRELNIIMGLFRRAVAWKLLTTSPATAVKKYRIDDTRVRVLTADEIKTVLTRRRAISYYCVEQR